jgi:predicted acyltransferase
MLQAELESDSAQSLSPACPVAIVDFLPSSQPRLLSLDALRGFTMFWIIGGSELAMAITGYVYPPLLDAVETQLYHATWKGFTVMDMVMPVFLFVVGAAMPLAFAKRVQHGESLRPVYRRIFRRFVMLWGLGILVQFLKQVADAEPCALELFSNTLQAIAVGYLVTSLALLHLRVTGQIVLLVSLIVGYWALLALIPFDGQPAGTLNRSANFARHIDMLLLGVFRRDHSFTWIITSLGFSATVLLGAMAGHLLKSRLTTPQRLIAMVFLGLACMAGGWVWSYSLPLNRHLWTSSAILWAGGWSFLLLALFHAIIDLAKVQRWAYPFVVIGANALLAYVLYHVLDCVKGPVLLWASTAEGSMIGVESLIPMCEIAFLWLLLWQLFCRRLFLRA